MNKKNPNLTAEQKLVMFEDGTEPAGTSELITMVIYVLMVEFRFILK